MMDNLRLRLLGSSRKDEGCNSGFEVLDQYADALLRGEDVAHLFPEVITHLESCPACREDTQGLIEALRLLEPPER